MAARIEAGSGLKSDKIWTDNIRIAAFKADKRGGPKAIRRAAEKLVKMAVAGDIQALKEMGNRLEGMPAQALAIDTSVQVTVVERRIVAVTGPVIEGNAVVVEDAAPDGQPYDPATKP